MSGKGTIVAFDIPGLAAADPPAGWRTEAPVLLTAADDHYAMPLAAALASVVQHLDPTDDRVLQLVLMDGGIQPETWQKLAATLEQLGLPTLRVLADRRDVADLHISHHISHTAYFRLLSSRWLPDWISRVIYLDCDVIVQADLRQLWQLSQDDPSSGATSCEVWAVPDIACPFIDPRHGCQHYSAFAPYFAALHPIRNHHELGLEPTALYFNSGVMVLDLTAWRKNDRSRQLLDCLRDNRPHVWCWDQYALNVVFAQNWGQLPLAWNFGAHAYDYLAEPHLQDLSPLLPTEFQEMVQRPRLIHYTTEIKPWHYYSFHPLTGRFFEYLDKTTWQGWRPIKPGVKTWWHVKTFRWQKQLIAASRRWRVPRG